MNSRGNKNGFFFVWIDAVGLDLIFYQNVFMFLRILGGVTDSFVFILHGEEFIVRENVFVQHLTDVSFNAAKQKEFL